MNSIIIILLFIAYICNFTMTLYEKDIKTKVILSIATGVLAISILLYN